MNETKLVKDKGVYYSYVKKHRVVFIWFLRINSMNNRANDNRDPLIGGRRYRGVPISVPIILKYPFPDYYIAIDLSFRIAPIIVITLSYFRL